MSEELIERFPEVYREDLRKFVETGELSEELEDFIDTPDGTALVDELFAEMTRDLFCGVEETVITVVGPVSVRRVSASRWYNPFSWGKTKLEIY